MSFRLTLTTICAALKDAFGVFDDQEHTFTELMLLTPARTSDGTPRAYVDAFRRLFNLLEKDNVPSFVIIKAVFLLHLPSDIASEVRSRLVGVTTANDMFHICSNIVHTSKNNEPMELDPFVKDKGEQDKKGPTPSKAPPYLRCNKCTGYGHYGYECPSRKKYDASNKSPPKN